MTSPPIYFPDIFEVSTFEQAQRIIVTPEAGVTTQGALGEGNCLPG